MDQQAEASRFWVSWPLFSRSSSCKYFCATKISFLFVQKNAQRKPKYSIPNDFEIGLDGRLEDINATFEGRE